MAKIEAVSPFAPAAFPALPAVRGVRLAGGRAGVRYRDRDDVMLAALDAGSTVAGVFTRSKTRSAPVLWCEDRIAQGGTGGPAVFIANAGNSNAFTGRNGAEGARRMAEAAASSRLARSRRGRLMAAAT